MSNATARRAAPSKTRTIQPAIAADQFVDDASYDADGYQIQLGDRVEELKGEDWGIVVAVAGEALIFFVESEGGFRGRFTMQNCADVRIHQPVAPELLTQHVNAVIAKVTARTVNARTGGDR